MTYEKGEVWTQTHTEADDVKKPREKAVDYKLRKHAWDRSLP